MHSNQSRQTYRFTKRLSANQNAWPTHFSRASTSEADIGRHIKNTKRRLRASLERSVTCLSSGNVFSFALSQKGREKYDCHTYTQITKSSETKSSETKSSNTPNLRNLKPGDHHFAWRSSCWWPRKQKQNNTQTNGPQKTEERTKKILWL